jgi:hypothetical protein
MWSFRQTFVQNPKNPKIRLIRCYHIAFINCLAAYRVPSENIPHFVEMRLCQSDHHVLGQLPSPPIAQFGRAASSRKSLGGSKHLPFFHLRMTEATLFLGTFNATEMFWYPSPELCLDTILSRSCTDNRLTKLLGFCSDMHCQLWDLI